MQKFIKNTFHALKDKHLFYLVNLKKKILGGFSHVYYSQTGEDIVLNRIFSKKKTGFYVDVGAYHPFHYSNTHLLYKQGWCGINIDPNPKSVKLFNRYRKRDTNICKGVSPREEVLPYYVFNHQSCNTFSEQQKNEMLHASYIKLIKTLPIQCSPLNRVLKTHLPSAQQIDVLNVDVEGHDLEVLQSNDWEKTIPFVIVVEDINFNPSTPTDSAIYTFLSEKGYRLIAYTGLSLIFQNKHRQ